VIEEHPDRVGMPPRVFRTLLFLDPCDREAITL
jgi:hypothetical protein